MLNNRRGGALLLLLRVLLICAAPVSAEQKNAERSPFEPEAAARESRTDRSSVKGVVGDGECWHLWSVDMNGRWHKRDATEPATPFFAAIFNKDDIP